MKTELAKLEAETDDRLNRKEATRPENLQDTGPEGNPRVVHQISDSINDDSRSSRMRPAAIEEDSSNQVPKSSSSRYAGLSSLIMDIEHLRALISVLENQFGPLKQKMDQLFSNSKAGFNFLWCLFPVGSEITFPDPNSGLPCAGKVHSLLLGVSEFKDSEYHL